MGPAHHNTGDLGRGYAGCHAAPGHGRTHYLPSETGNDAGLDLCNASLRVRALAAQGNKDVCLENTRFSVSCSASGCGIRRSNHFLAACFHGGVLPGTRCSGQPTVELALQDPRASCGHRSLASGEVMTDPDSGQGSSNPDRSTVRWVRQQAQSSLLTSRPAIVLIMS